MTVPLGSFTRRAWRPWHLAPYEGPALAMFVLLGWLTLVTLVHPTEVALIHSNVLSAVLGTGALLIAAGTTYVALTEFALYGAVASLYGGFAFLVLVVGDAGMRLLPLLLGSQHKLSWLPFGWGMEDGAAALLLIASALAVGRVLPAAKRDLILRLATIPVAACCVLVAIVVYRLGTFPIPSVLTVLVPVSVAILFFIASALFWQASKLDKRSWFFWLSISLGLAGFSEIQYGVRQYPLDVVHPGEIVRLVFFTGILLALAVEWSHNYHRLRWQARELGALSSVTGSTDLDDVTTVVKHVARVAGEALSAQARILLTSDTNATGRTSMPSRDEAVEPGAIGRDRLMEMSMNGLRGKVALGVPLAVAGRTFGILAAFRDQTDDFSTYDVRLLRAFGAQASILLERSLLYEEIAAGAVLQERSRLAREIHDGLAQHLAFLKMRVAWLKRSSTQEAAGHLSDIERVLETALIEARHAITTLRSEAPGSSTVDAIRQYAEEFAQVSSMDVDIEVEEEIREIGPRKRGEVLRIVQESLNNVRKHAPTARITLTLRSVAQGVEVCVKDTGPGFEIGSSEQGHFGLEIMTERAESIGGSASLQSTPHGGTSVTLWVPARESETQNVLRPETVPDRG